MNQLNSKHKIKGLAGKEKSILDFWEWAYSDIANNTSRGIFAEYLVAVSLGVDKSVKESSWADFDMSYQGKRIEVKSSAYLQVWKQNKLSSINLDIKKRKSFNEKTGEYSDKKDRNNDAYIFCIFTEKNKDKIRDTILDVKKWKFYVMATKRINSLFGDTETKSLSLFKKHCEPVSFSELKQEVDKVLGIN